MAAYLGILIFSFIFTGIALIPFIDLLYRLHLTYHHRILPPSKLELPEFNKINKTNAWKIGTPIGGGILIIGITTLLFALIYPFMSRFGIFTQSAFPWKEEINIIFFTFISFGLLGLYDDIIKIFNLSQSGFAGLKVNRKSALQVILSIAVALMLYQNLSISIIHLPYFGVIDFGWTFIPIASAIIFSFCRGFDITDGLDGLAGGIFLICLLAFWALSVSSLDSILSSFIAILSGSVLAFMYFNVYPARIWLGNAGSLAFGATLAVIGLILGKTVALLVIGGVYFIQVFLSAAQFVATHLFKRKIISISPFHYYLLNHGWPEPKVVMRAWLVTCLLAFVGLWLATA